MADPRHQGPNPKGPVREMTQEWKDRVLARLAEMGHDIQWLAAQLGIAESGAYKLFARTADGGMVQQGSSEVPRICELLGVPYPTIPNPALGDSQDGRIIELAAMLTPEQKDSVIGLLASLLKPR